MLISRCAWHSQYYGRSRWRGVVSWRGWQVKFTDGICARCLTRFFSEHGKSFQRRNTAARRVDAA
ncbi:MAG TPA: hypothetical protein VLF19_02905 [Methylomirabilota bacterium]|nr:hypothetical protein [Methylomirabilota bacterium]